jgi:hypothetical protein
MNDIIDLILYFGGGLFIIFSGDIIGHMRRFKNRPAHEQHALSLALILAVIGPVAILYKLRRTGRL